jgi:hypothetical protein
MGQFRGGYVPNQPIDPGSPLNQNEPLPPEKVRKRQGLAYGTQEQARPGMVGKQDRARKK